MHNYTAYYFRIEPASPGVEIMIAELDAVGFDSFMENGNELTAYIHTEKNHSDILENIPLLKSDDFEISYSMEAIEPVNWNEEWEKNFSPIHVENRCTIRAPFHEKNQAEFDIVIEPKMSFGTGHHATTYMMVQLILENEWHGKSVLDMGCGTGVLAILAEMKGAKKVDAIDIDNWCYQNTLENTKRNNCSKIEVYEGGAELLTGKKYDAILANINRNILWEDMEQYVNSLEVGGNLFLSGFYAEDLPIIENACKKHGLKYSKHFEREKWVAVKFVK